MELRVYFLPTVFCTVHYLLSVGHSNGLLKGSNSEAASFALKNQRLIDRRTLLEPGAEKRPTSVLFLRYKRER